MARKRNTLSLSKAKRYSDLLLYEATGGTIGTAPSGKSETMTFGEKRGLLDSLIKIASLEQRDVDDNPEESGMDLIRKQIAKRNDEDGGGKNRDTRDNGRSPEGSPHEPNTTATGASEGTSEVS